MSRFTRVARSRKLRTNNALCYFWGTIPSDQIDGVEYVIARWFDVEGKEHGPRTCSDCKDPMWVGTSVTLIPKKSPSLHSNQPPYLACIFLHRMS